MGQISRQEYAGLFGPTVGDKIRLADTGLYIPTMPATMIGSEKIRFSTGGDSPKARLDPPVHRITQLGVP
jgi:urease alpha subunit